MQDVRRNNMARTGYLITIYQDINPSSPTYNQTREERVLDETNCQSSAPANWIEDTRYCELGDNGMQTGYEIVVYRDVEPLSSTYNQTRQERNLNEEECESDNVEPEWVNIGEPFCRQKVYLPGGKMDNDGYWVQQQQDMNEYSPTANQIRDIETYDVVHCPLPDTTPNYQIISETCHTINDNGEIVFDGTKDVIRIDTNEYSSTYNFNIPETVNVIDEENCPKTKKSAEWVDVESYCETDSSGKNTGNKIIVQKDVNPNSSTYNETKNITVEDSEACPIGEDTPVSTVTMRWKFINNKTKGDFIQSFTVTLSNGSKIQGGGGLPTNGGWRSGTIQIPESDKTTQLTISSIDISPSSTFNYTANPSPYVWNTNGQSGSREFIITLTD